jgi:DNA-directed RNA polymerase subunit L
MTYDSSFAQHRLTQLTEQLLPDTLVAGNILFFADEEEGRVGGATWQFEDEDHSLLKDSDFTYMLMELLDVLIRYRASHGVTDTLNGIIQMKSVPDMQRVTANEAEKRRGSLNPVV